jgi:hypothetical protein
MGASKYPLHSICIDKESLKRLFLEIIKLLRTTKNYAAKLWPIIQRDGKLMKGLKSHDYHVLMQQVLPVCLCTSMQEETRMSLISLSWVFNKICLKVIDPSMMEVLKEEVVETMSSFKKKFLLPTLM